MKLIFSAFLSLIMMTMIATTSYAQIGGWNPNLQEDAEETIDAMIAVNPQLKAYINEAYGYAIFPKVTKGGMGIGGAIGQGVVYQNHQPVGISRLKQLTVGFQLGGQQYSEAIFFESRRAFERFLDGELKFDAQASAVAITTSASINIAYERGVAVFTMANKGLMYEATIGGQHFSNEPIEPNQ